MQTTRHIKPAIRRARLLAARGYVSGTIPWKGILSGHWDGGDVVRQFLTSDMAAQRAACEKQAR